MQYGSPVKFMYINVLFDGLLKICKLPQMYANSSMPFLQLTSPLHIICELLVLLSAANNSLCRHGKRCATHVLLCADGRCPQFDGKICVINSHVSIVDVMLIV